MAACSPSSSGYGSYTLVKGCCRCTSVAVQLCPTSTAQHDPWYFGDLSYLEAEKLLVQPGLRRGTFLLRNSTSHPGCLALSVRSEAKIYHYLIHIKQDGGFYVGDYEDQQAFKTIGAMVSFYRATDNFLCCKLTDICPTNKPVPIEFPAMEINRSSIFLTEKISSSQTEDVWCGTLLCGLKVPVHVSVLCSQLHSRDNILQETEIIRRLHHENVVQLYGVSTVQEPMYVVFECFENGSLRHYLREGLGQCISFIHKIDLATQVARGMDYLQSQLCVHRCLCARNVYISEQRVAKIANFRYAKLLMSESSVIRLPVEQSHIRWSSPEVLQAGLFSLKSDVWSFGILLTEVLTNGQVPYCDIESREVLKTQIVNNHYKIPQSQLIDCSASLYEVMQSCWRFEAHKRPKFDFIITGLCDCVPLTVLTTETLH